MCGILGTCGYGVGADEFRSLVDTLAHRGPDAAGVYLAGGDRPVWLGHRRLAIIDLSDAANQPFVKDGLALVFNGEIYNFRELRAELAARDVAFRTNSDTEVVLEGWRVWGSAVLRRLRGMFAFALYDERSGELVLARDPFGIKPLFYVHDGGRLAFASELKTLERLHRSSLSIDDTAFAATLLYDWIPEEHCIWRGVRKLEPGTFVTFDRDLASRSARYWSPAELERTSPIGVDELSEVLSASVDAHLVADVEIGSFLSGGLDSSLITALVASRNRAMRCFTIGFRDRDRSLEAVADDLEHARVCAKALGMPLDEVVVEPDVHRLLPRIVQILDEPVGDAAAINVLLLCEAAARAGLKVMLSGQGADELFSGYRRHRACLIAARYRDLPVLSRAAIEAIVARVPVASASRGFRLARYAKRFVGFAGLDEEAAYRRSYTYYEREQLEALLSRDSGEAIERLFRQHCAVYWQSGRERGRAAQLYRMFVTDLHFFLPALNLTYTDRASMATSVEVRVPFVDLQVVAAAARLSARDRIRGSVQKYLLKKVAEPLLPRSIVHRAKGSFGMPLRSWTRRDLRETIRDLLPDGELVSSGYVNRVALEGIIAANERGEADHAQAIWQLLTLEHWFRTRSSESSRAHRAARA